MTTPWCVPRAWVGQTCAIFAGGPSLTREQVEACRGLKTIAVNNTGIDTQDSDTKAWIPAFAPWADVLFAADAKWWHAYQERALKFQGLKICAKPNVPWREVFCVQQSRKPVFDPNPACLAPGGNSGYMALHLAVHFGATKILLLGFDMKDGPGGRRHWHGDHSGKLKARNAYATWKHAFGRLAPVLRDLGVTVVNCSPKSALTVFRRQTLKEALDGERGIATSRDLPAAGASTVLDGGHPFGVEEPGVGCAGEDRIPADAGLSRGEEHAV